MLYLRFYIFLTAITLRLPPEKRIYDVDKLFKAPSV